MEDHSSSTNSEQNSVPQCRICLIELEGEPFVSPCQCSGTGRYVHQQCVQQWIKSSDRKACEVCTRPYIMDSKLKPFRKWENLQISALEKRKLLISVVMHVIGIACVVWSIYVLMDRAIEEYTEGNISWSFWIKVIVVTIGICGGIAVMYYQCRTYADLFRRWQAYNRIISVQDSPEKVPLCDMEQQHIEEVNSSGKGRYEPIVIDREFLQPTPARAEDRAALSSHASVPVLHHPMPVGAAELPLSPAGLSFLNERNIKVAKSAADLRTSTLQPSLPVSGQNLGEKQKSNFTEVSKQTTSKSGMLPAASNLESSGSTGSCPVLVTDDCISSQEVRSRGSLYAPKAVECNDSPRQTTSVEDYDVRLDKIDASVSPDEITAVSPDVSSTANNNSKTNNTLL